LRVEIDIDDIIAELSLPQNAADLIVANSVNAVTDELYRNWKLEASNQLRSTRNDYINGLQIIDNSQFSKTIKLNGVLNNMVETGADAFDMKEGYSKSAKVKWAPRTDANGVVTLHWYLTIPFRHGVPTTIGDNAAFSGIMPKSVYNVMKAQPANKGLSKAGIPSPYDIPQSRAQITIPSQNVDIPEYKHKSSIYEGMIKTTGAYNKAAQNTYVSFRRVSSNSDEDSWIHKGIKAFKLLDAARAETDVEMIVDNTIDETLANLGYGGI